MRPDELHHRELFELDPSGGSIQFAGQRAILIDVVAIGLLRKYLHENFGLVATRAILTQFGFAHGWRMAEAMRQDYKWESIEDWADAGARIFSLEGFFRIDPSGNGSPLSQKGLVLTSCYEAEQHLIHFGQAKEPVCWTICGLLSGYLSRVSEKEIFVLEDRCLGKGDSACRILGRTREEWGEDRAEELHYFSVGQLEETLDISLQRVLRTLRESEKQLSARRRALKHVIADGEGDADGPLGIVVRSAVMRRLLDLARRVAKVDTTILITGESGTGKEWLAQYIHDESMRTAGPFIKINCGAVTETLLESELFGHARGAFTNATHHRVGLFEAASGGTLLLDEVSEISPGMQVKLLRVLQESEIRRVGENINRSVDVRVVATSNRELGKLVAEGLFREDLYYRLKVVELCVPPLRDRREDVLPLARVLLETATERMKRSISGLSPRAADQLLRYGWPGNVRELKNAMERAVAITRDVRVDMEDLPEEVRMASPLSVPSAGAIRPLEEVTKKYILAVLEVNKGNQKVTAEQLGIGSATLHRKLKSYGLTRTRKPHE